MRAALRGCVGGMLSVLALVACGGVARNSDPSGAGAGGSGTAPSNSAFGGGSSVGGGSLAGSASERGGGTSTFERDAGSAASSAETNGAGGAGRASDAGVADGGSVIVDLCFQPNEFPEEWSGSGASQSDASAPGQACPIGQLGVFSSGGCHYELVDATPYNVDPFVGKHSGCCYLSATISCP